MLKETGTGTCNSSSDDAAIAKKLGITTERIVRELVSLAFPDDDIRYLVSVEVQVAALESLNRIKPEVLAACGIQSTKAVQ